MENVEKNKWYCIGKDYNFYWTYSDDQSVLYKLTDDDKAALLDEVAENIEFSHWAHGKYHRDGTVTLWNYKTNGTLIQATPKHGKDFK